MARATRIRQPPENSATGRACAASSNPRPARIVAARAGAESAPMVSQPLMHFRQTMRVGGLGFRQQRQPFRIALQHGIEQGRWPLRRFLPDSRHAGTRRQTHVAAVERRSRRR